MVQGSLNQNNTFLGEKLWPVAWNQEFTILCKLMFAHFKNKLVDFYMVYDF